MDQMFKVFHVNDGCGRVVVKQYAEQDPTCISAEDPQPGEYVRVYGSLRSFNEEFHVSAHNIARLESPNELAYHFIEVAYVHLSLSGAIRQEAPQKTAVRQGAPPQAFAHGQGISPSWGGVGQGGQVGMGGQGAFGGTGNFGGATMGGPAGFGGSGSNIGQSHMGGSASFGGPGMSPSMANQQPSFAY